MAYNKLIDLTLLNNFLNKIKNLFATKDITTEITVNSDNIITFNAPINNAPLKSLTVAVEPVQDLHGYDSPWPAGGGKNLVGLNTSPVRAQILTSVAASEQTDEKVTLVSSSATYACLRLFYHVKAGTYTINFSATSSDSFNPVVSIYNYASPYNLIAADIAAGTPRTITLSQDYDIDIRFFATTGTAAVRTVTFSNFQFESGSTATAYSPYSNICPISGWTSATIYHSGADTSDPTTYTIQLGDTVYGGQLDVTGGKMVVDRANIASYSGETLPGKWISDRDVYAAGTTPTTGAQVVYELATPIEITLTPTQINTLLGTNNIWSDAGDVSVKHGDYIGLILDLVNKKTDKVQNVTTDNFVAFDENGNLKDSGHRHSDYLTEHQSLAAYRTATNQDTIDNEQNTRISNLEPIKTSTTINSTSLATFNTTIANMPFKELTITIEPAQSGSGDPSPINIRTITNQTECDLIVSSTTNAQDGTTYSITFPTSIGTFYGGTVDIVNKKLTVLYVLTTVNNFSNNWTYSSSTKQFYASNPALKRAATVRTTKIYSDKYKCLYNGEPFNVNYTNVIYSLNASLYIQGTEYNNVEDFLTNAGDTQICFPLTSPEEYNLSDIPEVVTLLGENNIWASYGNVTVTYGAYLEAINKHVECVEDNILSTIAPLENRLTALEGNHQKYYAKISLSYTGATARTRIMLPYDTVAGVYRIDTTCNVSAGAAIPVSVSDNSTAKSIAANGYAYLKMPSGDPSASAGKQIIFVVYPGSSNSGTIDITIERSNITDDITNIDIDYS